MTMNFVLPNFMREDDVSSVASFSRAEHLPLKLMNFNEEVALFSHVTSGRPTQGKFFGNLKLSDTGGITEVKRLFKWTRYFTATVFVVLLVLNTHNLLRNDLRALGAEESLFGLELMLHEQYLFRAFHVTPEFLIAVFELACLVWHVGVITVCLAYARFPKNSVLRFAHLWSFSPAVSGEELLYSRWNAIARVFREELPPLQAFSAMRTLQYITPGVLTPEVQAQLARLQRGKARPLRKVVKLAWFIGLRLLYLFFGAEAFLVKFRLAAQELRLASESLRSLIPIFMFLNQMLGIVQLNLYTNDRLFRFIFGGVDNFVDKSERRRMRVWNTSFEKAAWDTFQDTPWRFLALSLTFNDVDFQKMVLDDGEV